MDGRAAVSPVESVDPVERSIGVPSERGSPSPAPPSIGIRARLILADATAVLVGFTGAFVLQSVFRPVPGFVVRGHIVLATIGLPAFAVGLGMNKMYRSRANARPWDEAANALRSTAIGVGGLVAVAFALQYKELSRLWVFLVAVCIAAAIVSERAIARRIFTRMRLDGRLRRRILIVGTDAHAIGLMNTYLRDRSLGYDVVGFVGPDQRAARSGIPVLGPVGEIDNVVAATGVCGVVVSLSSIDADDVNALTRRLTDDGYHVALSSALQDIDVTRLLPQQVGGRTMVYVEPVIRGGWRSAAKRGFDVVVASTILLVTLPVMVLAAIAIKLNSRGPVLFFQTRIGRDGVPFRIVKFRTMVVDAESRKADLAAQNEMDGPLFKIQRDPRVTAVGRVLRKTSIDELPQLVCVLRGTMSVVGPRPALPEECAAWDDELRDRVRVPPGLTGMWQVSGRSDSSFEHYRRMDLYYVDNWSLVHDLRICRKTVKMVLTGRGAS